MQKICQYLKLGNGRGLRFIFYVSLLISIAFGGLIYITGKKFIEIPLVSKFVDSVPSFVIKDGAIQNQNLKWAALIPLTTYPVVIDTTRDDLPAPVPDGFYVTRRHLYKVDNNGLQINRADFKTDLFFSPAWLHMTLYKSVVSLAIGLGVLVFLSSWIGFFVILALSALVGLILRADLSNKRLWRVTALTWILAQIITATLSAFNIIAPWWIGLLVLVAINVSILIKLKD